MCWREHEKACGVFPVAADSAVERVHFASALPPAMVVGVLAVVLLVFKRYHREVRVRSGDAPR